MTNFELARMIARHRGPALVSIKPGTNTDEHVMIQIYKISMCKWLRLTPDATATLEAKVVDGNVLHLTPANE